MDILEQATAWVGQGYGVLPLQERGKLPDWGALRAVGSVNREGRPAWHPYTWRLPRADELVAWFGRGRGNYGVICGWRDLVVLDFDDLVQYLAWRDWASAGLRDTYTVITARGVHVYLRIAEPVKMRALRGLVEIKAGAAAYVVGPGSQHPDGPRYIPMDAGAPIIAANTLADVLPAAWFIAYLGEERAHRPLADARAPVLPVDPWASAAAARIPERLGMGADPLHRIKERLTCVDLVGETTLGNGYAMACCPIPTHGRGRGDLHPSLQIDCTPGHFYYGYAKCLSGCHPSPPNRTPWMDVINLWAEMRQISDRKAVRELAALL